MRRAGGVATNWYTDGVMVSNISHSGVLTQFRRDALRRETSRSVASVGDTTAWLYDEPAGVMTNKLCADGKGPRYTYTIDTFNVATKSYAVNNLNQYLQVGVLPMIYDADGNLTRWCR